MGNTPHTTEIDTASQITLLQALGLYIEDCRVKIKQHQAIGKHRLVKTRMLMQHEAETMRDLIANCTKLTVTK